MNIQEKINYMKLTVENKVMKMILKAELKLLKEFMVKLFTESITSENRDKSLDHIQDCQDQDCQDVDQKKIREIIMDLIQDLLK